MDRKGPKLMTRPSVTLFTAALAALVLTGTSARAGSIQWRYNITPLGVDSNLHVESDNNPGTYLKLTNEPRVDDTPKPYAIGGGTSNVVLTNIDVFSDAPLATPDQFSNNVVTFRLTLSDVDALENGLPNPTTNVDFQVNFIGTASELSSDIDAIPVGQTEYVFQLGNNMYTVKLGKYSPPGPPDADLTGSLSARIETQPIDIQKAPEPSTMVLSCVGLSFLGLTSWRKRRQTGPVAL